MSAAKLKPLLLLAKRQPVSCALALTRDKQGVILLHKRSKPRKLMAELLRGGKGSGLELDRASIRFGWTSVDGGSDSTAVLFTVNKPPPGPMHAKMLEKLRPAGFQRCEFSVDAELENESDDDEPEEDEDRTAAAQPGQDGGPAAHPPAPASPAQAGSDGQIAEPQHDPAALQATLRGLAEQIRPVLVADPARGAALVKLAASARDSLANGDLTTAQAGIDTLRQQLPAKGDGSLAGQPPALLTLALFSGAPADPAIPAAPSVPAPPPSGLASSAAADTALGGAEIAAPVLLRFALGGFAFLATLLIPTNKQRSSRSAAVNDRPEMAGTVSTAPGSRSGQVTIQLHGQHGQPDRELGTFAMDPDGRLTDGGHGAVLGTVEGGSIHLTPQGEAELLRRAGEGAAPASGAQPPSPEPLTPQQAGVGYETRNQEEADLAASLTAQGKSGQEIQAALDELRRNKGVKQGQGIRNAGTGTPASSTNPIGPAQPTPRDGVIGGKPIGEPEPIDPSAEQAKQDGLRLQAESEDAMAAAGYRVERSPAILPKERLTPEEERTLGPKGLDPSGKIGSGKNPDDRMGGNLTDMVAPASSDPDQVRKALSRKIRLRQAYRIVLNLGRTDVTREQVEALLRRKPIEGLQELFIIEKSRAIFRVFPNPGQITQVPEER